MRDYFSTIVFADNELWRIVAFFLSVLVSLVAGKLLRYYLMLLSARCEKKDRSVEALLLKAVSRPMILASFAVGLWIGTTVLTGFSESFRQMVDTVFRVLNASVFGYILYCLVDVVDYYLDRVSSKTESKMDDMLLPLIGKSIRITVVTVVVLQIAQSLSDKPITSILAGLGVGGLAIALAGQDTVKNLFGSLVIVADKPFEIGDRIVFEGNDGPVESVGFRSTKIRTLDGHVVTIPNSEMVNKVVKNISKRENIKKVMNIGVTYDTPPAKVERALEILRDIFKDHEGMDPEIPPRIYFNDFCDSSLNIIVLFWYHPPEYWDFLAFCECVNIEILKRFNEEGIEFAFPTRTLYLKNEESS
jgi:MscS family membrane protein